MTLRYSMAAFAASARIGLGVDNARGALTRNAALPARAPLGLGSVGSASVAVVAWRRALAMRLKLAAGATAIALYGIGVSQGAAAVVVAGPVTQAQFDAFNGSGASYGPPSNATFPDGPFTVASGATVDVTGGPKASSADDILFVLSGDITGLGASTITFTFNGTDSVVFSASDFFTTAAAGFPSMIGGIANGAVNGIKFPGAEHAGAEVLVAPVKDALYGTVAIISPIDLRVDVFGVGSSGLIVGNAANSGAEGITGGDPPAVPETSTWAMMLLGIAGLGYAAWRGGRKQTVSIVEA